MGRLIDLDLAIVEFTVKPVEVIDVNAEETRND